MPRNGFEPSHPCERCDLNTVRLPISPPGLCSELFRFAKVIIIKEGRNENERIKSEKIKE